MASRVLCFDYRNEVGNVCIVGSSLSGLKKGRKDIDRARCLLGSATWPRRTPYSGDGKLFAAHGTPSLSLTIALEWKGAQMSFRRPS